jgi:hypothetical protein
MTRQDLIAKSTKDPDFREKLKADPRATVSHEFAMTLPDDLEITVLEETPKHAYIVLPVPPSELTPEELAAVSGGVGCTFTNYDTVWDCP